MAQKKSFFYSLMSLIGLLEVSEGQDGGGRDGRPQGAATYTPPNRKGQGQSSVRPVRGQDEYDPRQPRVSHQDDRYADAYRQQDYRSGRDQGYMPPRSPQQNRRPIDYNTSNQDAYPPPRPVPPRSQSAARDEYPPKQQDYPARRTDGRREGPGQGGVVVPFREPEPETEPGGAMIFYLHKLDECCDVIDALLGGKTVVINTEDMDVRLVQRGADLLSGAAFALNANLEKTSDNTIFITPRGVQIQRSRRDDR